jgi:hypothetical protein
MLNNIKVRIDININRLYIMLKFCTRETLQENKHFATLQLQQFEHNRHNVILLKYLQRFIRRFLQPSQCFVSCARENFHVSALQK